MIYNKGLEMSENYRIGVHLTHCNQGENIGTCCYHEDDTCPALKNKYIPRQDSLTDQLKSLINLATQHGLYDAADWLTAQLEKKE